MKTALGFVVTVLLVACADDPSTPSGNMKIYETCLETQCDVQQSHASSSCSACTSACMGASYDCDSTTACASSCSPTDCSDYAKNECNETGFKVTMPNDPSPEIAAACRRELSHIADCGYQVSLTSSDCDRFAASETADHAANYDCVAQLDCSLLTDASAEQGCDVTPSTFGDDFCATLASACPDNACSSDLQSFLDEEGAWARSDALDAVRSCLSQPSCGETSDCVSAWVSAVK